MRKPAATQALAALAAVALTLAACGGDDGGEAAGDTTTSAEQETTTTGAEPETTTTTSPPSPEEQAVRAYNESWEVTFRAINPPRELPRLRELMTGEALSETLTLINGLARDGHTVEGRMETHPVVVSVTSTEVLLDDCAVENSVEYDGVGQVVDPAENLRFNYRVSVIKEAGTWKVADFERREEPCVPQ